MYGCGSSILLNSSTRVNQYEHVGKWDKVLLNYDVKLSHSHDAKSANGINTSCVWITVVKFMIMFKIMSSWVLKIYEWSKCGWLSHFQGLANALKCSGLLNLLNTFLGSLPSDQKDDLYSSQMECLWRLGQWGTASSSAPKVFIKLWMFVWVWDKCL